MSPSFLGLPARWLDDVKVRYQGMLAAEVTRWKIKTSLATSNSD